MKPRDFILPVQTTASLYYRPVGGLLRNIRKYIISPITALILLCLTLSACKHASDQPGLANHHNTTRQTNPTNLRKVAFQTQWLHQAQFAGFYMAQAMGFYRQAGLQVKITMGGPDRTASDALLQKKTQFVSMFLTTALRDNDQGNSFVNIAQLSQKSSLLLVAKQSSGIKRLTDINGKRIGFWSRDFNEPSLTLLKKYDISAQIIPVSWTINVLTHDVVDVMNMMYYNEYDILLNSGYRPDELTVFPLADYGVNIPEDGVYCLREYYLQNTDLCHDFADATMQGWIYAMNHENETLAVVMKYLKANNLPANIPHQKWMLQRVREAILAKPENYGILSVNDYDASIRMLKESKLISQAIPYKEFTGYAPLQKD